MTSSSHAPKFFRSLDSSCDISSVFRCFLCTFMSPHHPPIACLEYQKQLLVLFQFFCVPKRGPVESISFLLTYSKGTNRVLVFGIGPIAVSFSSLCLDGPAYISSKQDSIYAIKTLWFCKQCRGKKKYVFKFLFLNMLENSFSCTEFFSLTSLFPSLCAY